MLFRSGNIVDDDADLLVNTVNAVGIMGRGVALAFKTRWPSIMSPYTAACRSGALKAGGCLMFDLPDGRKWAALATKDHWRDPSRYHWVETGLVQLRRIAKDHGIRSIAIPPPGCGNGGLDWNRVRPLVVEALREFDLRTYAAPGPEPVSQGRLPGM
jgi:O-acetyl-ADP-ribose deacetylase (regulator of RNase III)